MALRLVIAISAVPATLAGKAVQIAANEDSYDETNYAGYMSVTSVSSHAGIDYDQEALEGCSASYADMTDYLGSAGSYSDKFACAKDIYMNGQGAGTSNPSSSRTLQGFSLQVEAKMSDFNNPDFGALDKFVSYYMDEGNYTYANKFVMDAINGAGIWNGLTLDDGEVDNARWQCVKKGTAYMNVPMYALYEYFRRAHQVNNPTKRAAMTANDKVYKAVHGWDEGWAFWAGQYARKLENGVISSSNGKLVFNLAEKRDAGFSTDTAPGPSGAQSWVNYKILAASQIGRDALTNFTSAGTMDAYYTMEAYKCIEKQAFIPMIQGCLQYAYKSDACTADCGDEFGELYVFCAAMIPIVHQASASAATTIMDVATLTQSMTPDYTKLRDALYPVLNDMGYKCSDIGIYSDDSSYSFNSVCNDTLVPDSCGMAMAYDEYTSNSTTSTSEVDTETTTTSCDDDKDDDDSGPIMLGVGIVMLIMGLVVMGVGVMKLNQARTAVPTTEMSKV